MSRCAAVTIHEKNSARSEAPTAPCAAQRNGLVHAKARESQVPTAPLFLSLIACFVLGSATAAEAMSEKLATQTDFDIAAQPLSAALKQLAYQAGTQILFEERIVQEHHAPAIRTRQSAAQALNTLLANTDLEFTAKDDTVAIRKKSEPRPSANAASTNFSSGMEPGGALGRGEGKGTAGSFRLARAEAESRPPGGGQDQGEGAGNRSSSAPAGTESSRTDLQEIIVTGTRMAGRSSLDTVAPVDVLSVTEMATVASADLQDVLQALSPSFNVSRSPVDDGGTFVRTPTMRGLPGGEVLVLLNGKRVHRSAFISLSGEQDNKVGSQSVDLSQFPVTAVKRIEVLRDGAAAQYGSDAIAGVINIILNDEQGFGTHLKTGRYFAGDGDEVEFGLHMGLPLTDAGHANFTLEVLDSEPTSRGVQRADAQAIIDAGGPAAAAVPVPAQVWGKPNQEWIRLIYDLGLEVGEDRRVYLFGNYGISEQDGDFFYRNPNTNGAFGRSALQDGPNAIFPTYSLRDRYPGGFTPRFFGKVRDFSVNFGIEGQLTDQLTWDLSGSHGESEIDYRLERSINPSMGPESPTTFHPGTLLNSEQTINLDLVYAWAAGIFASPVNVAFGTEFRRETYEIRPGDAASYSVGDLTDLGVGSNGFQGFGPSDAGRNGRNSYSGYIDVEADVTERLQLGAAARAEHYADFGSTVDAKLAGRFEFSDAWAIRAAASTGFRAPTVGQTSLVNSNTTFENGELVANRILPPTNPISQLFGGAELQPEESVSFSAGLVFQSQADLSLTLDFYRIDLDDRMGLSRSFTLTPADQAALDALGVPGALTTSSVRFFINGYDSRSTGVDLVAAWSARLSDADLEFSLGLNHNKIEITRISNADALGARAIFNIENMVPETKGTLSVNYTRGPFSALIRGRYYGDWSFSEDNDPTVGAVESGEEFLVDLKLTYEATDKLSIALGAENLFDNFPDPFYAPGDCCGRIYSGASPYGFDGGLYYVRLGYKYE